MQAITDPPKDLLTPVGGRHSRSGENIQPRWAFILCAICAAITVENCKPRAGEFGKEHVAKLQLGYLDG